MKLGETKETTHSVYILGECRLMKSRQGNCQRTCKENKVNASWEWEGIDASGCEAIVRYFNLIKDFGEGIDCFGTKKKLCWAFYANIGQCLNYYKSKRSDRILWNKMIFSHACKLRVNDYTKIIITRNH